MCLKQSISSSGKKKIFYMFVWNQAFHMVNVATIHSNTNKFTIQSLKSLELLDNLY